MGYDKEREKIKSAYPNRKWAKKVDRMSDDQIIAIFKRLRNQNKI